jgi:predicted permease
MSFFPKRLAKRKAELDEEIQSHLEMDIQARMERGESAERARAAAMRELGNVALIEDVTREMWGWMWLERVGQDLRYAIRQLRRSPVFMVTVVATLALGLGATAAMFTVVDRVLLRPLPYEDSRQLVEIKEAGRKGVVEFGTPFLDLQQWNERSREIQEIAFYDMNKHVSFLEGSAGSTQVSAPQVSANLFAMLGVHPALGRSFDGLADSGSVVAEEAQSVILSDSVWREAYGGDAKIPGKTVKLNGKPYVVLGVMPRGFRFPFDAGSPAVWLPIVVGDTDAVRKKDVTPDYQVIGRLKAGSSPAAAESELKVIQAEVSKAYTDPDDRELVTSVKVQRYDDTLVGSDLRKALLALFGASGVLWLIACVNGTSLMLARAAARQREIAVRGALGASRWRIVHQLLVEGLLLSALASTLGMGLAMLMLKLFEHGLMMQFHIHEKMAASAPVIGVLVGLTVATALLCSVWPALAAARASIEPVLRQGGPQTGASRAHYRMRASLVVAQIAMSLTLLVGCGLLLRTIYTLRHVPLGFRTDHVIVANMTIPAYKFAGKNMTTELYQPLVDRVNHMPGVQSATLMTEVPLGTTGFKMTFTFGDKGHSPAELRRQDLKAEFRAVGPEMQRVFGFSMLKGRFFNEGDTTGSQPVAIVNRAFAKAYLGENEDLGKILGESLFGFNETKRAVVVGVFDDERQVSVAQSSRPEIEVSIPQIRPDTGFYFGAEGFVMDLAVRTERSPSLIIPELRELMRSASPELSTSTFTTMDQIVEDSYGSQQLAARLLMLFGGSALLLCVAGIYGLLAYMVTQRTRELGLRIALGAQRSDVAWLVLRQACWMLIVGSGAGLVLAYLTSLLLSNFLYGVRPHDPWTMGMVTLLLLMGGLAAAYVPARRAAMVDPMEALRAE